MRITVHIDVRTENFEKVYDFLSSYSDVHIINSGTYIDQPMFSYIHCNDMNLSAASIQELFEDWEIPYHNIEVSYDYSR